MRIDYAALPPAVRRAIEQRTGVIRNARSAEAGTNCAVAAVLETDSGAVFLKGVTKDDPGVVTQQKEAELAPFVAEVSPRLLWHEQVEEWDLLAFEAIEEPRHADYTPGSPDVPKVLAMLDRLAGIPCPPVAMFAAQRRWGKMLDDPQDAKAFAGSTLLHTDWHQFNVLITGERAWLVDWAWAARGAAFIDPALIVPRLIAAGHTPVEAEGWAQKSAAWQEADQQAVTLFSVAVARMLRTLADKDPHGEWRRPMVEAATAWARHRGTTP